ncbi:MAG: protein kinase, partial [Candidatus Eisenbacteria bacterium]
NGIVHRDLKPGNVMITPAGLVKVLDFGLAKSGGSNPSVTGPVLTESPTMGYEPTGAGIILGTAAYMSPEQARGRAVDKRSDIWSFGCVLYECLAGRQCFEGETVSDLIARILQTEPEWEALPAKTPGRIRELLRRCLEKDARRRLRDIGDARIEIEDVQAQRASDSSIAAAATSAARTGRRWTRDATLVAIAAAVAVAGTLLANRLLERPAPLTPMRFEVADAPGMNLPPDGVNSAISPDGTMLVFAAGDSGRFRLWVRPLSTLAASPLAGTDGGFMPFWSPDSRHIGFFTENQLKRVDAAGGEVDVLCDVKRARGGTWNRADQILFAPQSEGGVDLIPAGGGDPRHVTVPDSTRHETAHRFPQFLPDGRHFLFSVLPPQAGRFEIDIGSIDSPKREKLCVASSGAWYDGSGHLLYLRQTTLVAQPFDPTRRRLTGDAVALHESVTGTGFSGGAGFSTGGGTLTYATFKTPDMRLSWTDLQGHEVQRLPFVPAPYTSVSLSPDGHRAVFMMWDTGHLPSLWLGDLERGIATRFSQEPEACENPIWSPDGTRIAYFISQLGPQTIVVRPVDGGPAQTYLADDAAFKTLCAWTPDGGSLVFGRQDPVTRFDIWVLPLTGEHKPWSYLASPFNDLQASISLDGRWLCYLSDESGRPELYVQSFPKPGSKYQVTTGGALGAGWPHWGGELLYAESTSPGDIVGAQVLPGEKFRLGPPHPFAKLPPEAVSFDVAPDRKRMIMLLPAGKPLPTSITVVLNWQAAMGLK